MAGSADFFSAGSTPSSADFFASGDVTPEVSNQEVLLLLPVSRPSGPDESISGLTDKYFQRGVGQVKEGASSLGSSILAPNLRPLTDESSGYLPGRSPIRRAISQGADILEMGAGALNASTAPLAAVASNAIVPPLRWAEQNTPLASLEKALGAEPGVAANWTREMMPDLVTIFGPALASKAASLWRAGRTGDVEGLLRSYEASRVAKPQVPESKGPPLQDAGEADALSLSRSMKPEPVTSQDFFKSTAPEEQAAARLASDSATVDSPFPRYSNPPELPQSAFRRRAEDANASSPEMFYHSGGPSTEEIGNQLFKDRYQAGADGPETTKLEELFNSLGESKIGKTALDSTVDLRRYLFNKDIGKTPEYMQLMAERRGGENVAREAGNRVASNITEATQEGSGYFSRLLGPTAEEKKLNVQAYRALKGDVPADLPLDSPVYRTSTEAREVMDGIAQEKLARGMLTEETVAKDPFYTRRLYQRDIDPENWAARIDPEAKAKGIQYIQENEKIRTATGWRPPTSEEAQAIANGIITKNNNSVIRRTSNLSSVNKSQFMKRQEIPEEILGLMGPMDDAAYLAGRTVHDGLQSLATHDFLNGVSQLSHEGSPIISQTPRLGYTKVEMNDWTRRALGQKGDQPLFVHDIYAPDFISQFGSGATDLAKNPFDKLYRWAFRNWRANQTFRSPGTQISNLLGDVYFSIPSQTSALNPANWKVYFKSFKDLINREGLFLEAIKADTLGPPTTQADLLTQAKAYASQLDPQGPFDVLKTLSHMTFGKVDKALADVYNFTDNWFKLAAYTKKRSLGFSPAQAAEHVNTFYPRYDRVSPMIQAMRSSTAGSAFASPFVSFAAETARISKNALMKAPISAVMAFLAVPLATQAARLTVGATQDEMKQAWMKLPPESRSSFGSLLLPWRDKAGHLIFVDMTSFIPYGNLIKGAMTEGTTQSLVDMPVVKDIVGGNPIINLGVEIGRNIDLGRFKAGEKIQRPSGSSMDLVQHGLESFLPPLAPGGRSFNTVLKAASGQPVRFGQKRTALESLGEELTRFRPIPIDSKVASFTQGLQASEERRIDEDLRRVDSELSMGKISKAEYKQKVRNLTAATLATIEHFHAK